MSRIKMIFWIIVFIIALILVILNESKRQEKVFKETLIEYPDIRDYEDVSGIIKTFHVDRGGCIFPFY